MSYDQRVAYPEMFLVFHLHAQAYVVGKGKSSRQTLC